MKSTAAMLTTTTTTPPPPPPRDPRRAIRSFLSFLGGASELFAHLLEAIEDRLGLEHVVEQAAAGDCVVHVGQVSPRDALDERFTQRHAIDRLHPVGLKLGIPRALPAAALAGIEVTFGD